MHLEIEARHTDLHPEWKALIDDRLGKLAVRHPDLLHVRVGLAHAPHHQLGAEEADVTATVRGATLRATKHGATILAALHAALDAFERELATHRTRRRDAARHAAVDG